MSGRSIAAAAAGAALLLACASPARPAMEEDPYLWLEEVQSQRALDWVRDQNARSLPELERDGRFAGLYNDALQIAQSRDRLPTGEVRDGYLYNFWQDETHVRGV